MQLSSIVVCQDIEYTVFYKFKSVRDAFPRLCSYLICEYL